MIRITKFRKIDIQVKDAVREVFEFAKKNEKEKNDYYLFLANATYVDEYKGTSVSPYVLDHRIDVLIDQHRLDFLAKYIRQQYSFTGFNSADSRESLTIEMMIYTHIWESKNFLKLLKRLVDLCQSSEYEWHVSIPDSANGSSKQDFIRTKIRDVFANKKLKIAEIIKKGYRSQFRNAFAHSDYSFGLNEEKIDLHNYKPGSYEVKDVSMDDWTEFFCHSFLLNFYLTEYFYEERRKISAPIEVLLKNKKGQKKKGEIRFDKKTEGFAGSLKEK